MEEIGDAFEIEFRKEKFYYDCLDYFVDRRDFELIQMDTDSLYFATTQNARRSSDLSGLMKKLVCLGQME